MPTIYYERFDLDAITQSDVSRLVGAHVFHQASYPPMRDYGMYMCGVGSPNGPCEIERIDAPFHVLIVLLGGQAELFEDGQSWTIGAGQFGVLPARGHRGYRRIGAEAMPHVWFLLNDEPRWDALNRPRTWFAQSPHGARLFDAVSLFQREAQLANDGAHDGLASQALDLVSRQLERLLDLAQDRPEREQALLKLLDQVRHEPAADWSVAELCERIGLGATQLHRICQQRYGRAPIQLVCDIRMQLAREWLSQGRSVTEVATALGYQEIASFSRRFSRHFGCAPSRAFREKITGRTR